MEHEELWEDNGKKTYECDFKEGKEFHAIGIENILNKIIEKKTSNRDEVHKDGCWHLLRHLRDPWRGHCQ